MLSTKTLKSVNSAKSYFLEQDDYYLRDAEGLDKNQWLGKGAAILGLKGQVEAKDFEELLAGTLPNGEQLGKIEKNEVQHRPGFDLTFSAPKSVSILAEVGQDIRIYKAHDKAVTIALAYIEKSCAQARKTVLGKTEFENTQNIVAAVFHHDTSRKLDPQLHSHCVVMNATQRADDKWRSLASDKFGYGEGTNGFIERVRENKVYFGAVYRSVLAYELKQLGYEIIQTHADGRFEIAGISREVIEHFSQRREEIVAFLKEKGWTGGKAAAFVTLETRNRKENIPSDILHEAWLKRSAEINFDPKTLVKSAQEKTINLQTTQGNSEVSAKNIKEALSALNYAIEHLSEREVCISHHKLINIAASSTIGDVSFQSLVAAVDKFVESGFLIPLENREGHKLKGEQYYTTGELLKTEKEIIELVLNNQSSVLPTVGNAAISVLGERFKLNTEQLKVATNLMSSVDRFIAIDGIAGSGKTHVLDFINILAKKSDLKVIGLVPTQAQAKAWHERSQYSRYFQRSKIYISTVSSFIEQYKKQKEQDEQGGQEEQEKQKKQKNVDVILVDNAQLISARQLKSLFTYAENINAKIVLAGDTRAYLSIEAGSPFSQLIKSGLKAEILTEIQKEQQTKAQIQDVFNGNLENAFRQTQIVEETSKEKRFNDIANHYVSLEVGEHRKNKKTLLLMPNKKECIAINQIIRTKLKENGVLGKSENFDVYLPKSMTKAEMRLAKNYEVDNVLRFSKNIKDTQGLEIKHGEYWKIAAINQDDNALTIMTTAKAEKSANVREIRNINLNSLFHPTRLSNMPMVEVFIHEKREIAKGEKIQFFRSKQGITSGDIFTVKSIKSRYLKLVSNSGNKLKLAREDIGNFHVDYGYSTTPYRAQHLHPDIVLAHNSSEHFATNQRVFYKELAQAKEAVYLYTDNKENCLNKLKIQTGDKTTALDAIFSKTSIANPKEQLELLEKQIERILI